LSVAGRFGRIAATLAALATLATPARAQKRETQAWTALFVTVKAPSESRTSGFSGWFDLHGRRGASATTVLVRPGLGYRLSDAVSLWAGYAYVGAYADGPPNVYEHRAWQQALVGGSVGQLTLQLRPRVEQRFRGGEDPALRARLFARANVALWPKGPLAIATWDEVFVQLHTTSWGAPGGFDQNRLFLGLGFTQGALRLEAGYLSAIVRRADDSLLHQQNLALSGFLTF
jgi:hypothetical protein